MKTANVVDCLNQAISSVEGDIVKGDYFRSALRIARNTSITAKDKNVALGRRELTLELVEPGLTPRYLAGPEDQPRHTKVCLLRYINVTPIIPGIPAIYGIPGIPMRDVRACALSPSGWGTCQIKHSIK